jgi:hypothetical protein
MNLSYFLCLSTALRPGCCSCFGILGRSSYALPVRRRGRLSTAKQWTGSIAVINRWFRARVLFSIPTAAITGRLRVLSRLPAVRLDGKRAARQRLQQLRFRRRQSDRSDPGGPVLRAQDGDLAVVIRHDVRTRLRCQYREAWRLVALALAAAPYLAWRAAWLGGFGRLQRGLIGLQTAQ